MTTALNEDIFALIFSHTSDFEVLRSMATAIGTSNQHPLRSVVLRRLLQSPFRLSSDNLEDSKALINHFVHNVEHTDLVRDIAITLGPSRKSIVEDQQFRPTNFAEDLKKAERAEELVKLLPELLKLTKNLQRLDWSKFPPPNRETFEALSKHSTFTHLSLDCSAESIDFPSTGVPGTATEIKTLLSTIGSKVPSLDLRDVDEDIFKVIQQDLPPLKNVRNLRLDLTCGVWDWDGAGSPQQGPTEHYRFPRISNHVEEFEIKIADLLARQQKGPIELVDTKKLKKLKVEVIPCFAWTCIDFVRVFSGFTSADFSSLVHLTIDDSIRDSRRWTTGGDPGWEEVGRAYTGIHELIAGLPQLRHLWVNEHVLAVPSSNNKDNLWDAKPFEGDSQDTIMSRTVDSPHWEPLGRTFEKLESLRVGFGPLNTNWVTKVLSHCDHSKLSAFGFDWEWQSSNPGEFSELIATLSGFKSLADLHILHPYPSLSTPLNYNDLAGSRLTMRRVHETKEMKDLVKVLLSELPSLYRVGIGRNSVWERQTRWKEGDSNDLHVQRLHRARVPSFYDAGSSHPLVDIGVYEEYPAVKDVLNLLKEL